MASAFALATRKDQNQSPFDKNAETMVMFDHLAKPENTELLDAFSKGMSAIDTFNGKDGWLDFDWSRFDKPGGVVADVSEIDLL
jgi:hypothetical protein